MENEEIIKKIIQSDFEEIQLNEAMTHKIIGRLDNLPRSEVQPIISKEKWIKFGVIALFFIATTVLIDSNIVIQLDLPGATKSVGMFLAELKQPLIGLLTALVLIIVDRALNRRKVRVR